MTQIEQICAEIEHQLTICKKSVIESNKNGFPLNSSMHTGEEIAYTKMLDFINSLPQEPASEELEEAVEAHRKELDYWGMPCGYKDASCKGFKTGANWQKQQLYTQAEQHLSKKTNGEITLEDTVAFNEGLKIGKQLMEEQMMKDAKEGIVTDKGDFIKFMDGTWVDLDPTVGNTPAFSLKEGQNVKLIVIKEE